ncbi:hypothetical protein [Nonomuraea dietziae]|uniref:hypothetical protein n=1 Tax=Nonomuraea dietziae TaxID=65515 RepID=UPI003421BC47
MIWLAQTYRNIKFAMNVHSYGGYFMWPPGAYQAAGRVTLPRPTRAQEAYFLRSARTIEEAIAAERGTVTWPQQTGPLTVRTHRERSRHLGHAEARRRCSRCRTHTSVRITLRWVALWGGGAE